jgi:Major Facilitator Superfamily
MAATSWRMVFLINVPVGTAVAVAALRTLPVSRGAGRRADLPGVALLTIALLAVVLPLVLGREAGWPPWTWVCLAAAIPAAALFAAVERRTASPLVNLRVIAHPPVRWAMVTLMLSVGTYYALLFALAQHLQHDLGESPAAAGLTAVPWVAAFGVAGRLGRRAPVAGCLLLAAGYGGAALAGHGPLLMAALGVGGFGLGLQYSSLLGHLTEAVPNRYAPEISGVSTTGIQIGGAVGIAAFGTLYLGTRSFALTAAGLAALALVAAAAARQAVKPRISSAVSSGTSSWGEWPTPSSSTQSAPGSHSWNRAAADGQGSSRSSVPHTTRTGQAIRSGSSAA